MIQLERDPAEVDGWCLVIAGRLYIWERTGQRIPRVTWRRAS